MSKVLWKPQRTQHITYLVLRDAYCVSRIAYLVLTIYGLQRIAYSISYLVFRV